MLVEADAMRDWPAAPFPLSLIVKRDEHLVLDYQSTESLEEISVSLIKDGRSSAITYIQRGKLNFHKKSVVAIVTSSDRYFRELSILHIGSQWGHRLSEKLQLSQNRREMIVEINVDVTGSPSESPRRLSVFKRFRRIVEPRSSPAEFAIFVRNISNSLTSDNQATLDFLCNSEVSVVDTVDIVKSDAPHALGIKKNAVTHRFEEECNDDERVTYFSINVQLEGNAWTVYRRYKEFDSLRHIVEIYVDKTRFRLPKFPSKSLSRVTGKSLVKRMFGLNKYLTFLVDASGFGSPNVIDVLMSFLEIPDHIGDDGAGTGTGTGTGTGVASERGSTYARSSIGSPIRESMGYAPSREQKKIISDLMVSVHTGRGGGRSASSQSSNSEAKDDWRTVVSEVSAPDNGAMRPSTSSSSSASPHLTADSRQGKARLTTGIAVLKHGRNGGTQNRILKLDLTGQTLYWYNSKKSLPGALDAKKSINLKDVLKVQLGVKYVRGPLGNKECIKNCTAVLSRSGGNIERLKRCLSLIVPDRTLDIECVSESDCSDLHAAFLDLTRPYS
jgi:hypothetical protein